MQELSVFSVGGKSQQRSSEPHAHVYIRAPYGVFKTADGYITLAFPSMKSLAAALDVPALAEMDDEKDTFERRDEIYAITREKLLGRNSAEWLEIFDGLGIWAGPVYSYEDVINDPQVQFNGTFVEYEHPTEGLVKTPGFPIKFSRTPSKVTRGAPLAGEHTREILLELGLEAAAIDKLLASKVVGESSAAAGAALDEQAPVRAHAGNRQ
jgi:crotonobetainyl-CoA:carnitine CoA-transferase CaiB-like acyl-CoA transferase